jgi:hypothetical protein
VKFLLASCVLDWQGTRDEAPHGIDPMTSDTAQTADLNQ